MGMDRIAAIDGGGTKTEFVLTARDGTVLRRVLLGASNPFDIGYEACEAILRQGLTELLTENGQKTTVNAVFAGLSGGSSGDSSRRLAGVLERILPDTPHAVSSDMVNAIASGSLTGDGCAVIAGTGSSCLARVGGKLTRCGGWGYLLDGAGSGYDLGAGAIMHTLRVGDGREQDSPLARLTVRQLGGTPAEKLTDIYAQGKRYIASFAPVVFEACDEGDAAALALVRKTGEYLAEIIRTACKNAGLQTCAVVCIGGLWNRKDLLAPIVEENLPEGLTLQYPTVPPVFGATAEAARLAGCTVTEAFRSRFLSTYHT